MKWLLGQLWRFSEVYPNQTIRTFINQVILIVLESNDGVGLLVKEL